MEITLSMLLGLFVLWAVWLLVKANRKKESAQKKEHAPSTPAIDCCGAHEVCDFDRIKMDETIIEYFDDEELDAYKNIDESQYTDQQVDEFREVLYTLKTSEIRYWLLSIDRRRIKLPSLLQDEARMLMSEG
jgi:hypothetical protein